MGGMPGRGLCGSGLRGVSVAPPLTLRVNQLITTREVLLEKFAQVGISAKPTSVSPFGILIEEGGSVPSLPGFHEGAFYVEDEAAQLIPPCSILSLVTSCSMPVRRREENRLIWPT